jgi:hypothetical protein
VIKAIRRQSLNAPEGIVSVDDETQHTWRPVSIGKIRGDGQFDLVWSSDKPIRPIPYPPSRTHAEWESFLEGLYRSWGGWANPGKGGRSAADRLPVNFLPSERGEKSHSTATLFIPTLWRASSFSSPRGDRFATAAFHPKLSFRCDRP